ncbi:TIGR00366 family protein [uncultured Anaerotruncus sp.]|uniref:short-chain fatty acid transporter n=1 Tax=uncultured Anaerotruncus sp. TaxID=905011 RepID=UPI00280C2ADD|nr:TIGR00366 family protein [uncultured Anaerotruncus sp.]
MASESKPVRRDEGNAIARVGASLTRWSMKYMPDPSIFAVVLTLIAFVLGIVVARQTPMQMVQNWYKGLWELLAFAMQMCLIIITGSAVAEAPIAKRGIRKLAGLAKSGKQAAWLVTFVSVLASFLHWGLSLIVGALLAKELAKELRIKKIPFEYGLIAAGAYVGQMTWQGMLSSSIGLLIATPGHFLEDQIGVIPISQYMFNPMNIIVTIALLVLPPIFAGMLHPKEEHVSPLEKTAIEMIELESESVDQLPENPSVGDRLNHSRILAYALALMGVVYIVYHFATKGFDLDINMVNAIFLFAGIIMHGNIANYIRAVKNGIGGVSGIVFQFPLYAGIMGMIKYSGLVDILATGLVSISTPFTFPLWTFISASIVNLFVPSGGGQWAVQGPIAIQSAMMMNADIIKTALAVGYGNTWTNMFQPFWAIALLGVTGLKAKDIMGYTTAIMLMSGLIFILGVLFLPV